MRTRLTLKQAQFIGETIKTKNPTEAVRRVYSLGSKGGEDNEATARAIASENLTKPLIQKEFKKVLSEVDYNAIVQKWNEWALSDSDRRVAMEAGKELMKLGDKYPAGKLKAQIYNDELGKLTE